ncbi:hypothetical protein B0T14DRAFT_523098 [Immersiella caudata]|uniref:NTF2-like domain-containing protein n=1 Tax=Immersiella caudata TaxID=314043 RepID=A0AA39WJA4_9PEZI|nr:hypothetical protein B0T14DRAFT_523098 [Immersiella caudata]
MRFFSTLTFAAAASAAAIGTTTIKRNGLDVRVSTEPKKCLCKADVDELVDAYVTILSASAWDPENEKYIHDDFLDVSDSINTLIPPAGLPLGNPIFNKETFIQHQIDQPDNLPVVIEKLGPWNCNGISFVWTATFKKFGGQEEKRVRGITILETAKVGEQWQIKHIDVEFNTINYLLAIGGSITRPGPPPA